MQPRAAPPVSDAEAQVLSRLASIIRAQTGIVLGPEKHALISSRLRRNLTRTGARDLREYLAHLEGPAGRDELPELVSALTTNFTHFFREKHHFEFLRSEVLPAMRRSYARQISIWSAGCSTGQEPYSIALSTMSPLVPAAEAVRPTILATDIDRAVLAHAGEGLYTTAETSGVPPDLLARAFQPENGRHRIRPEYRAAVEFRQMNLHEPWGLGTQFDVIFCRNVVIYFDPEAQMALWDRFARQLKPGGWLMVGHSERVPEPLRDRLRPVVPTVYQLTRS